MEAEKKTRHARGEVWEQLGLREARCAACGVTFEHRAEHAWKLYSGRRTQWYCSYHCMRQDERARLEATRVREEEKREEKSVVKRKKTELERAQEKVDRCRARYKQAQEKTRDAKAWAVMTRGERKNASSTVSHWMARLILAEKELEDVKRRGEESDAS